MRSCPVSICACTKLVTQCQHRYSRHDNKLWSGLVNPFLTFFPKVTFLEDFLIY